jgi:carbonic anhydrase
VLKFVFQGSLTTPKCNPSVTWVLFPETISVSINQIGKFRSLSNGIEGLLLVDNYRHLQPIGNRKVFLRSVSSRTTKLEKLMISEHSTIDLDDEDPSDWYYN